MPRVDNSACAKGLSQKATDTHTQMCSITHIGDPGDGKRPGDTEVTVPNTSSPASTEVTVDPGAEAGDSDSDWGPWRNRR